MTFIEKVPDLCCGVCLPVVSAGARAEAPHPGEAGHSGPELEKQNEQPGEPQRHHRAQYVRKTGAVIERHRSTFKHTPEPFFQC